MTLIAEARFSRDLGVRQVRFPQQMSRALRSDACGSVQNSLARGHFIGGAKPRRMTPQFLRQARDGDESPRPQPLLDQPGPSGRRSVDPWHNSRHESPQLRQQMFFRKLPVTELHQGTGSSRGATACPSLHRHARKPAMPEPRRIEFDLELLESRG